MKPSPHERADLADKLRFNPPSAETLEGAWAAAIKRRISEIDNGAVVWQPWDEVMAAMKTIAES